MILSETFQQRVSALSSQLGTSPEFLIGEALSMLEERAQGTTEIQRTAQAILVVAQRLQDEKRGFSMEEMITALFPNEILFGHHKAKIQIANVLRAGGYVRKQVWRTAGKRPRLWIKQENV